MTSTSDLYTNKFIYHTQYHTGTQQHIYKNVPNRGGHME